MGERREHLSVRTGREVPHPLEGRYVEVVSRASRPRWFIRWLYGRRTSRWLWKHETMRHRGVLSVKAIDIPHHTIDEAIFLNDQMVGVNCESTTITEVTDL